MIGRTSRVSGSRTGLSESSSASGGSDVVVVLVDVDEVADVVDDDVVDVESVGSEAVVVVSVGSAVVEDSDVVTGGKVDVVETSVEDGGGGPVGGVVLVEAAVDGGGGGPVGGVVLVEAAVDGGPVGGVVFVPNAGSNASWERPPALSKVTVALAVSPTVAAEPTPDGTSIATKATDAAATTRPRARRPQCDVRQHTSIRPPRRPSTIVDVAAGRLTAGAETRRELVRHRATHGCGG